MGGIFPAPMDGGIPPNEQTPDNPPQAFNPQPANQPKDTSALYYGLGCDVKIRAPVLNSLISEFTCVLDRAGIAYEAGRLDNLARAIFGGARFASAELDIQQQEIGELQKEIAALKKQVAALTARIKVAA